MQKTFVDLMAPKNSNAITYGGALDIANGSSLPEDDIKFSSLFYEHILVHDGYFYCFGPLFERLWIEKDGTKPDRWLSKLLENGVLVPAIRRGDAMLPLWQSASDGVRPGELASVEPDEGSKVLEYVDDKATAYAAWPTDMATANTIAFPKLLHRLITSPENPFRDLVENVDPCAGGNDLEARMRVHDLTNNFAEDVSTNASNTKYRRGDIEQLVWRHVKNVLPYDGKRPFDPWIYRRIETALSATAAPPLLLIAANRLLMLVTTAYEIYHASQYKTVGGLFPRHSELLVATGIYNHLKALRPSENRLGSVPLREGSLDVSLLTVDQIIEIRKRDEFKEYLTLLARVRPPLEHESFYEANEPFVIFLLDKYVPMIVKTYPSVGWVGQWAKRIGLAGPYILAQIVTMGPLTALSVGEKTMLVSVAGFAGNALTTYSEDLNTLADRSRRRFHVEQFRKTNHYGLFEERKVQLPA